MNKVEPTGLPLEYQREYGTARKYVDITNPSDYPLGGRIGRVFGPGFFEQISSFSGAPYIKENLDGANLPVFLSAENFNSFTIK